MSGTGETAGRELAELSDAIRSSSQQMAIGLSQVRQLAEELCIDLDRSCALAQGAASLTELFDAQLRVLDDVFGQLGYTEAMAAVTSGSNHPDDLSVLYTMESERMLQLGVFGGAASMEQSNTTASSAESDDGVELF